MRVLMELEHWKQLGNEIRTRRLELDLTIEDVADETKIRVKFLISLETGDCDDLPPGHLRDRLAVQYLQALGLSREDIAHLVRPRRAEDFDQQLFATLVEQRRGAKQALAKRLMAVLRRIAQETRHSPDGTRGPHPALIPVLAIAFLLGAGLRYSMDSKPAVSNRPQKKSNLGRPYRAPQPVASRKESPGVGSDPWTPARSADQIDRPSVSSIGSVVTVGLGKTGVVGCGPEHAVECIPETVKVRAAIPNAEMAIVRSRPRVHIAIADNNASRIHAREDGGSRASAHPSPPRRLALRSMQPEAVHPIAIEVMDLTPSATAQSSVPSAVELLAHSSAFQRALPSQLPLLSAAPVNSSGAPPPQAVMSQLNRPGLRGDTAPCCGHGVGGSRQLDELQSLSILRRRLGLTQ